MATYNSTDVRREISQFLISLRQSVDPPPVYGKSDAERDRNVRMILMIEEARLRFRNDFGFREQPSRMWPRVRDELMDFANKFMHSRNVDPRHFDRRFRPARFAAQTKPALEASFFSKFYETNDGTVADALIAFTGYLESVTDFSDVEQPELKFEDLKKLVPRQKVAPVQFDVRDGKIVVVDQSPIAAPRDLSNISAALDHIKASGNRLIENLENSNCDRRLLDSVRELQTQLTSDSNIIRIGLGNFACGAMFAQFQPELPDAIAAMFGAYCSSVSMYVRQFPEWEQFTQKAMSVELDDNDIQEVDAAAEQVIAELLNNPTISDPAVPKTIAFCRQFLALPGASSKRAAFAMIRTIENLVSSILNHASNFFRKTAEKTVESGSSVASKVIVTMLGVALIGAVGIAPAATQADAPWVKQVIEIIKRQLEGSE